MPASVSKIGHIVLKVFRDIQRWRRDPLHAVVGEQRREAVVVAHHRGVGELAAQCPDLGAVSGGLKCVRKPALAGAACVLGHWSVFCPVRFN
jgi:hypothetical protein